MSIPAYIKRYANPAARNRAYANYRWLAALGSPMRLPGRVPVDDQDCLAFEQVEGRHAMPGDLPMLAGHLGDVHGAAYVRDLYRARLGQPHHTQAGLCAAQLPGRPAAGRRTGVASGHRPGRATPDCLCAAADRGADGPAAYYKDANPRNFLITPAGNPVTIDFDDLTLAPFGYDLAKLIVTLAMTHGPIPGQGIATALSAYNAATARHWPRLPGVARDELMNWVEIHDILTSRYAVDGRYSYSWDQVPARQSTRRETAHGRDHHAYHHPPRRGPLQRRPRRRRRPRLHGPDPARTTSSGTARQSPASRRSLRRAVRDLPATDARVGGNPFRHGRPGSQHRVRAQRPAPR